MVFYFPTLETFDVSLDKLREAVQDGSHEGLEVRIYEMGAAEFLMKHWAGGKELPKPVKKMFWAEKAA